ncbi:MAG: DUF4280 domain-containing protein, partial [Flavobacteriaceae bacterium]|nr:DUF4280 domain-containing protein [Flavobacteriaceae bacterium]
MEEYTIDHILKMQSNGELENRYALYSYYSNTMIRLHKDVFVGSPKAFIKRFDALNGKLKWGSRSLEGQTVKIPLHRKEQAAASPNTAATTTTTTTTTAAATTSSQESPPQDNSEQGENSASQSSGKKEVKGLQPICQGASCKCNQSKDQMATANFKVVVESNTTINDKDGGDKLVGTTQDKPIPFENQTKTFGSCKMQPLGGGQFNICTPNIVQWDKAYTAVHLSNQGELLLKESIGICSFGGEISFKTHGQEAAANTNTSPVAIMQLSMLSPLLTTEELVQAYQGILTDQKGAGVRSIKQLTGGKQNHIKTASISFQACDHKKQDLNDPHINWVVYYKAHKEQKFGKLHEFIDHGGSFLFHYRNHGDYRIEAYGKTSGLNTNPERKISRNGCIMEISVREQGVASKGLRIFVGEEDRTQCGRVRPGEKIRLQVDNLFADRPPISRYYWDIQTKKGKEIIGCLSRTSQTNVLIIEPQQLGHKLEISVVDAEWKSEAKISFKVGNNFVKGIEVDKDTICVKTHIEKDRHILHAKVSQWAIEPPTAAEEAAVQWVAYQENTKNMESIGSGAKLTKTSDAVGQWYVEAYMKGPEGPNRPTSKHISVVKPSIKKAYWADQDGNPLSRSGHGHTVYIHIETQGLVGEKLQLHVWDMQKGKDRYVQNAKKDIVLNLANGDIIEAFQLPKTPSAKELDNRSEFFFTLSHFPENVENAWQDPECDNQFRLIPNNKTELLYVKTDE